MGVGYTTIMYDAASLETGFGDVKACRYDGIEIGLEKVEAAGPDAVAGWLDEYDLELYCVMSNWVESEEVARHVADQAETVADLGADYLGILPPQRHRNDDATVESWLQTISDAATDAGLTPLLHHHGATHVEQGDEIRHFLDAVDGLQLLFDTAHWYPYGENYPEGDVTDGIERFVDDIVTENTSVRQEWPQRHEAEAEHGFDIYQGGIPSGEQIRLIHVEADVQACAGTHVSRTGDIGTIKLLTTERVQDGVERINFAAGAAAIEHVQSMEANLHDAASILDVTPSEVPDTAERFFEEWKERGKQIDQLKEELAAARAGEGDDGEEVELDDTVAVIRRLDADMDELRATANAIVEEGKVAVLGSGHDGAQFVVAVPDDVAVDAGDVVGELASRVGGGGGGPADFAQGGGPNEDDLDDALADAPSLLKKMRDA